MCLSDGGSDGFFCLNAFRSPYDHYNWFRNIFIQCAEYKWANIMFYSGGSCILTNNIEMFFYLCWYLCYREYRQSFIVIKSHACQSPDQHCEIRICLHLSKLSVLHSFHGMDAVRHSPLTETFCVFLHPGDGTHSKWANQLLSKCNYFSKKKCISVFLLMPSQRTINIYLTESECEMGSKQLLDLFYYRGQTSFQMKPCFFKM